jgi:hypothetical protein
MVVTAQYVRRRAYIRSAAHRYENAGRSLGPFAARKRGQTPVWLTRCQIFPEGGSSSTVPTWQYSSSNLSRPGRSRDGSTAQSALCASPWPMPASARSSAWASGDIG